MSNNDIAIKLSPAVGEDAPEAELVRASDCSTTMLSAFWKASPVLLVFMRHLGCSFCREQVGHLQQISAEIRQAGTHVVLISVNRPEETHRFCLSRNLGGHFTCLSDPARESYMRYGLSRVSSPHLLTPHVLSRGIQAVLHGHFTTIPKADPLQLPGIFLVNKSGVVKYAHRNRDASDNPSNREIMDAINSLS